MRATHVILPPSRSGHSDLNELTACHSHHLNFASTFVNIPDEIHP